MFIATKIESTIKPNKFESLNNGVWYYNYDIVEKTVLVRDMDSEEAVEESRYEYLQVRIQGEPTVAKCYEAILKEFRDETETSLYDVLQFGNAPKNQIEDIYFNIEVDFGMKVALSELEKAKKEVVRVIDEYDKSPEVNSFFLNGVQVWLDKETRVGLMNSINIEQNAGKVQSTLWFGNVCIVVNCDAAIQMLSALELYALACYNKTAEHKVNVEYLDSIEAVDQYDYTAGYPEKLRFNI